MYVIVYVNISCNSNAVKQTQQNEEAGLMS